MGLALLTKSIALMVIKIMQQATLGVNSTLIGVEKQVIDKNSKDYLEYQFELK